MQAFTFKDLLRIYYYYLANRSMEIFAAVQA